MEELKKSHNVQLQQRILAWIGENFRNPDVNLAMLADHFNISKKYVSQFLKEQTGKTFTEYLEKVRLDYALDLLKNSDLSITEISEESGFLKQNTFYKAFRRSFGISPAGVRKNP